MTLAFIDQRIRQWSLSSAMVESSGAYCESSLLYEPLIVNTDPKCALPQAGEPPQRSRRSRRTPLGARRIRDVLTVFGIEKRKV